MAKNGVFRLLHTIFGLMACSDEDYSDVYSQIIILKHFHELTGMYFCQ